MLGSISLAFSQGSSTTIAVIEGSSFDVDFLQSESHTWDVSVTSHPVEIGSEITDHIQPQPRSVTITARQTAATLNIIQLRANRGQNKVENAKQFLTELYRSRRPVMLVTRLHTYEKMVATSITQSSSAGDGESLPWSVTFREIETVNSASVQLAAIKKPKPPPPKKGKAAKKAEAGKKASVPATPPETQKAGSALFNLGKAFGLVQ